MDLQQLRTFTTIAKEGSLSRASLSLCLSQPAISAQIKALEEELQLKLFNRSAKGMALTPAGQILLEDATKALLAANNVSTKAQTFRGSGIGGKFKLGTISDPKILRLPEFFSVLVSRHSDLKLSLSQGISGDIIDKVISREMQAGYVIGNVEDPRLQSIETGPITLRIVAPVQWKKKIEHAGWEDIVELPWLSTPAKCSFRQIARRMFERNGVMPQTVIEADQETMLSDLVIQGIGLTLLREDVAIAAEQDEKIAIWSPGIEIDHLYFVYLREEEDTPLMQAIIAIVKEIWRL